MEQTIKDNDDFLLLEGQGSGLGSGKGSGKGSDQGSGKGSGQGSNSKSKNVHMNNEQVKLYYKDVTKLIGNMDKSLEELSTMDIGALRELNKKLLDELKKIVEDKKDDGIKYYFVGQTTFDPIDVIVLKDEIIEDLIQKQKEEYERCKNSPGVKQNGNTCWIAAAIQFLYSVSFIREFYISLTKDKLKEKKIELSSSQTNSLYCTPENYDLMIALFELMKIMNSGVDKIDLTYNIKEKDLLLIDNVDNSIHDIINRAMTIINDDYSEGAQESNDEFTEAALNTLNYCFDDYKNSNNFVLIKNYFYSSDNSKISSYIKSEYAPTINISNDNISNSIQDLYDKQTRIRKIEFLTKDLSNHYRKEDIEKLSLSTEDEITHGKDYYKLNDNINELIVLIGRVDYDQKGGFKKFKMNNSINILKLTIDDKMFKVKGCVCGGGITGGHYVYVGFKSDDDSGIIKPEYVKDDGSTLLQSEYLEEEYIFKNCTYVIYQRDYVAEKEAKTGKKDEDDEVDEGDEGDVVAYDFDGVVHTLMESGQENNLFGGSHKKPDHTILREYLYPEYKDKDVAMFLVPHINMTTINDMLQEIRKGNKIAIVTANDFANKESGKDKIIQLLQYFGIEIDKDFIKYDSDKNNILTILDPVKFVDDTYNHIEKARALLIDSSKKLNKLVLSIPYYAKENNREGKYFEANELTNVSGVIPFTQFKNINAPSMKEVTPDKEYKNGIVTLLSYNVLWELFAPKNKHDSKITLKGDNVIKFINAVTPDIMFLCEAGHLTYEPLRSKIKLEGEFIEYVSHNKKDMGSIIYFNNNVFEKIGDPCKCQIRRGVFLEESDERSRQEIVGDGHRNCISVKLKHKVKENTYVIIGCHLGHNINPTSNEFKDGSKHLLKEVGYEKGKDKLIIMGDFNEFCSSKVDKLTIGKEEVISNELSLKQTEKSCCIIPTTSNDRVMKDSFPRDVVYSDIESLLTSVYKTNTGSQLNSDHSDHYPILGFFDPDNIDPVNDIYKENIKNLTEMGFEEEIAIDALEKNENNLEKAADYLLSLSLSGGGLNKKLKSESSNSSNSKMYSFF